MRLFTIVVVLLVLLPVLAVAQYTVATTVPANGATGVARTTTVSITFSGPADTTRVFTAGGSFMTNIVNMSGAHWSADRLTYSFDASLDSNTVYFIAIFNAFPSGGGTLTTAYGLQFTTGSSFPTDMYTVSGTLTSGTTGVSPAGAIVGMSSNGIGGQHGPDIVTGAVTDASGNFTIHYVPAGSWTPIAAQDVNHDGNIDPATGDVIAVGSLLSVTNADISGLTLVFQSYAPLPFLVAKDSALAYAALNLPANWILRGVQGDSIDSLGHASDWSYFFNTPGDPTARRVHVQPFKTDVDSNTSSWFNVGSARQLLHLGSAALPDSFIAHVEQQGGKTFRLNNPAPDTLQFACSIKGGDLRNSEYGWLIPDTVNNYWGATYAFQKSATRDSALMVSMKFFIGDFATGSLVAVTSVSEPPGNLLPAAFALDQNYPNPFNPTTVISGQWSVTSVVRLTVYDILGREVAVLADGQYPAGKYTFTFNGTTLSSGVYFCRLTAGNYSAVRKMSLVK